MPGTPDFSPVDSKDEAIFSTKMSEVIAEAVRKYKENPANQELLQCRDELEKAKLIIEDLKRTFSENLGDLNKAVEVLQVGLQKAQLENKKLHDELLRTKSSPVLDDDEVPELIIDIPDEHSINKHPVQSPMPPKSDKLSLFRGSNLCVSMGREKREDNEPAMASCLRRPGQDGMCTIL